MERGIYMNLGCVVLVVVLLWLNFWEERDFEGGFIWVCSIEVLIYGGVR